ncbi:MAG: HYR domain-containing protein, partial [Flavobacteriales bacterium]|nr:HYR domain-containing protein [Flavobacteriales bacterium]
MKRLLPLLIITAVFGFSSKSTAQTALCQNFTVQLDGTGNYSLTVGSTTPQADILPVAPLGVFTNVAAWQSFTAGVDGVLYSASFNLVAAYAPASSLTVNVYDGEGNGGTLLAQRVYSNPATFNAGAVEFVLDESLDLVAGNIYTVEILDGGGTPFQIRKNDGDAYPDGRNNTNATSDFVFGTKMLQRPDIDNGSTAVVGLASFGVDVNSFDCSNIGTPVTVTLTVTDNASSSTSCTSTITVEDNEAPVANCITTTPTLSLDGLGDVQVFDADINDGSSDNCGFTLSLDNEFFDCDDIGIQTVNLTVTDPSNNSSSCSATVEIVDNSAPSATCKPKTLVLNGSGSATLVVADVDDNSTDNCGILTRGISKTSFNCGDLGANTVQLTITDVNSNSAMCNATVTVEDNQFPAIICPADIEVCSMDNSGSVVSYIEPNGTDNCNSTTGQTDGTGLTNGSLFPIGTTAQTWTVTDIANNATSCSFNVIVNATPIPDFSSTAACQGEAVNFTDESTIDPSSSIVSWSWNMGDGSGPITLVDPIHQFADTGLYAVTLTVE